MNNVRLICDKVMDVIFESSCEDEIPLLHRLRFAIHVFFCAHCSEEQRRLRLLKEIQDSDFFPSAPSFEEKVMERLAEEMQQDEAAADLVSDFPGGFSFRSWVIMGLVILVSLTVSFFGIDFFQTTFSRDSSFLIPLGITVGAMLTGYGIVFIASHLKELSEHFKIH